MIRQITLQKGIRIPRSLKEMARKNADCSFTQIHLDERLKSIEALIPYPAERQSHGLVVLGDGYTEMHVDGLSGCNQTTYCIPINLPKGAMLWQNDQGVVLEIGSLYSFNQHYLHGVAVPDGSRTYSAFFVVDVLTPKELARMKLRGLVNKI
jgi:hypothetical protein